MNKFNNISRISEFIGLQFIQICIGESDILLRLYPDSHILITSSEKFFDENAYLFSNNYINGLKSINGNSISDIKIHSEQELHIILSNNLIIKIFDDSDHYESVVFNVSGECVLVV